MRTVYTEKHALRDAKTELYGGEFVPPFECPVRAEYVLARVKEVGLVLSMPPMNLACHKSAGYTIQNLSTFYKAAGVSGKRWA